MSTLDTLPLEILLLIFEYCAPQDLGRLDQVCKRFHQIIRSDIAWTRRYKNFLVTNQVSEQFRKRCNLLLPRYSKCFISHNWIYGKYEQHIAIYENYRSVIPCLQLTTDQLCLGSIRGEIEWLVSSPICKNDYYDFGDCILKGRDVLPKDSEYTEYSEYIVKKKMIVYNEPLIALDAAANFICSSSRHEYVILRVPDSLNLDSIENNIVRRPVTPKFKICSLACHPMGTKLSVGIIESWYEVSKILHIDLEYGFTEMEFVLRPFNITDILWEDQNTLLTCGGNRIEKWDLRVCNCVSEWTAQLQLTCISSDHHNTMITGTKRTSAILWDQRMNKIIQTYYMHEARGYKLELYEISSLRFDSTNLYCTMDRYLCGFDFSKHEPGHDYKFVNF